MLRYSLRRIPSALIVLAIGSVVIFTLLRLVPGDPAQILAGPDSSPEALESIRDDLGLTGSQVGQYFSWLGGVASFDLGHSLILGGDIAPCCSTRSATPSSSRRRRCCSPSSSPSP